MPVPVPAPDPPNRPLKRGFHLPARQPYARATERRTHEEALFGFGEYSLFVLMWNIEDFDAGRVERCSRCQSLAGSTAEAAELIFDTFKATTEDFCVGCLGTTFEGGWKAKIVRPGIWDYREEVWSKTAKGMVLNLTGSLQTPSDFFMREGDVVMRGDGTRWKVKSGYPSRIHDGFGLPSRADSNLGYIYPEVTRDDKTLNHIEPLTRTELTNLLDRVGDHWPTDTSGIDQIRGPLLPEMNEHSPVDYRPIDEILGSPNIGP